MLRGKSPAPHTAVRRMYVITLGGAGEISLTDGKKFPVGPGTVDVVEDTTGQGHLTNNIDDRLTVWLKLADSSAAAQDAAANANASPSALPAMSKAFKPVTMMRIYNGPDGLGHAEEIQAPVAADGTLKTDISGAELHWQVPSANADWHRGPRHQYVITLLGTGEVEVSGGEKIPVGPGSIDLIDDTAGKGHITRNFTPRLTLWLPFVDQSDK
jgi:quercetin dioxygenase-like cupin family protein